MSWAECLRQQAASVLECDFLTVDTVFSKRFYVLFLHRARDPARLAHGDHVWGAKTLVARLNRPVCSQIAHSACATRAARRGARLRARVRRRLGAARSKGATRQRRVAARGGLDGLLD